MKINSSVFFIPPYISTSWSSVSSLLVKEGVLIVHLLEGDSVEIPHLPQEVLELIFNMHTEYLETFASLEKEDLFKIPSFSPPSFLSKSFLPLSTKEGDSIKIFMQSMGGTSPFFEHDPLQSTAPLLPEDLLKKIRNIAHLLSPEEVSRIDTPVDKCHCPYCQVIRALGHSVESSSTGQEEPVTEKDLTFSDFTLKEKDSSTYIVQSNLNIDETYEVTIGEKVACSCGTPGCEHIIAVLKN